MPPADVPVRVREPVVAVTTGDASITAVVEVAERQPPHTRGGTPRMFCKSLQIFLHNKEGKAPLGSLRRPFTPVTGCGKPPADAPVRAREPAVAVTTGDASTTAGVEGAERQPLINARRCI